jgi:hypothetical protein
MLVLPPGYKSCEELPWFRKPFNKANISAVEVLLPWSRVYGVKQANAAGAGDGDGLEIFFFCSCLKLGQLQKKNSAMTMSPPKITGCYFIKPTSL